MDDLLIPEMRFFASQVRENRPDFRGWAFTIDEWATRVEKRTTALEDALHAVDCPVEFVPNQDEQGGCVHCGVGTVTHQARLEEHGTDCAWRLAHEALDGVFCPNCRVRKGEPHLSLEEAMAAGTMYYFDVRSNQAKAAGCRKGRVFGV